MAKKGKGRPQYGLVCEECKKLNYVEKRNIINTPDKVSRNKFCNKCRAVKVHKEVKKLK